MSQHAQLTVNQIRGPYMQLLTNLQGKDGRLWLDGLCAFLRKQNPWIKPDKEYDAFELVHENLHNLESIELKQDASVYVAWKVIRASDRDEPLLQFFLGFGSEDPNAEDVLLEFDEVISVHSIISLVNEQDWSRIQDGISKYGAPTEAFLQIGVQTLLQSLPFSTEIPEFTDTLNWYMTIPGRSRQILRLETSLDVIEPFLKINYE